jgi:hypothetical protein
VAGGVWPEADAVDQSASALLEVYTTPPYIHSRLDPHRTPHSGANCEACCRLIHRPWRRPEQTDHTTTTRSCLLFTTASHAASHASDRGRRPSLSWHWSSERKTALISTVSDHPRPGSPRCWHRPTDTGRSADAGSLARSIHSSCKCTIVT